MLAGEGADQAEAVGFHAGVKGDELDAVLRGVNEGGQFGADVGQFRLRDPDFGNGLLPGDAVAFEVAAYAGQAPRVGDVVGDEAEGAGHKGKSRSDL